MTKSDLMADLDYASQIAKDGATTPLLGGPIGLMWGVLLCVTFTLQWAIITQTLPLPPISLAFLWIGFAVIGGIGCAVLGRKVNRKPGANSVSNRVESYVWIMFTGAMASLALGIILNQIFQNSTPRLWDIMVIVGFAGQGLAYGVVAKMSGLRWVHMASLAGFVASAVTFSAYGTNHLYLIGAVAIIFTVIIPSLISMKKAG